ncbi:MAG: ATP-binding protein [Actinomycetota bacterium]
MLVALLLAQRQQALARGDAEAADWAVVTDVVGGLQIDLQRASDAVGALAAGEAPTVPEAGVAVGVIDPAGAPLTEEVLTGDDLARPEVRSLLARARDSGQPSSTTPLVLDAGLRSILVAPTYRPGAPLETLGDRRAAVSGFAVATLDLGAMAATYLPEGDGVRVTVGERTFIDGAGDPSLDVGQRVDLYGYLLDIRAGRVSSVPVSGLAVLIAIAGLLAGAGVAARILVVRRRLRAQGDDLARGEEQAQLIAEVAPIVQQSLDLADVLPAIAVQLRDHFGLAGIHLAAGTGSASEVEVFGLGARTDPGVVPALTPPSTVRPGESLSLALQRGGRSVARLDLVAARALAEEELRSLRVLSELVTAAVVNANLYAAQQDAVRRLRDLDALKTVFLSTASHELRTPATAIGGFASLLEQRWDAFPEERRQEMVGRIAANARSLGAVVEDLLDFSLLDRREQPLPTTPTDLGSLARGVVDRLATLFADHELAVEVHATEAVVGEQNALERVVTNLLTNAAKFSPKGTTIRVAVEPAPGGARLVVSDQGPGVPEEDRARIFTRFYRGSGEAVVQTRGVGIGLSVVMELVERLGGTIGVGDADGGGARFEVWLPAFTQGDGEHDAGELPAVVTEEVQDA